MAVARSVAARADSSRKFTTETPAIQEGVTRNDQALGQMARQRRPRQLERIAAAFADAVEVEEFERAAGWLAVARWHVGHTEVILDPTGRPARVRGRRMLGSPVHEGGQSMGLAAPAKDHSPSET